MPETPAPPAAEIAPAGAPQTATPAGVAAPGADGRSSGVPAAGADPFSADEYRQFAMEDGRAGKFIGWLLCVLFVYTILVASAAIWWTINAV